MGVILEVTEGPFKGRKIVLASEQSLIIGRAEGRAQYPIPLDTYMSSVHFSVEVGRNGCRIRDLKSANGTLLNGSLLQEGVLINGDEIKAGKSTFRVSFVPDANLKAPKPIEAVQKPVASGPGIKEEPELASAPLKTAKDIEGESEKKAARELAPAPASPVPPSLPRPPRIVDPSPPLILNDMPAPPAVRPKPAPDVRPAGRAVAFEVAPWKFAYVPAGWEAKPDFGFQFGAEDEFPTTIVASQECLGAGVSLQQYVTAQTKVLRQYFKDPTIEAITPPQIEGATEAIGLEIQYPTKDGHLIYVQRVYAKHSDGLGIIALTTLKRDAPRQVPEFDKVLAHVSLSRG